APPGRLPVLVRSGAILPLATDWPEQAPHDFTRVELTLFAGSGAGATERALFFDDGLGWGYRDRDASLLSCRGIWDRDRVRLAVEEKWSGRGRPELGFVGRGLDGRRLEVETAL
ncbi:MAG: hypothetical protein ABJK32_08475, partial [Nitratireductor sp.]